MRVAALIFMILLALILESTVASPGKGKKGSGRYRGYRDRRYRRSYCRPYQRRDCLVTMWSEWCSCSHGCGNSGVRSRTRQIISPAKCGGRSCPLLKEEQTAKLYVIPVLKKNFKRIKIIGTFGYDLDYLIGEKRSLIF